MCNATQHIDIYQMTINAAASRVLRSRDVELAIIGSLRIDDFCTTTPLGHVIVPSRRPVEI